MTDRAKRRRRLHPTAETADALLARLSASGVGGGGSGGGGRPGLRFGEAVGFLRAALAGGGESFTALGERAEAEGISKATLKRARYEAGVSVTREGGRHGRWVWKLGPSGSAGLADAAKDTTTGDGLLYADAPTPPSGPGLSTSSGTG